PVFNLTLPEIPEAYTRTFGGLTITAVIAVIKNRRECNSEKTVYASGNGIYADSGYWGSGSFLYNRNRRAYISGKCLSKQ
ncbi:hypothetical protein NE462_27230, partial [Blautia hominis]|nr:hypothetical protein [Blautia hominis]